MGGCVSGPEGSSAGVGPGRGTEGQHVPSAKETSLDGECVSSGEQASLNGQRVSSGEEASFEGATGAHVGQEADSDPHAGEKGALAWAKSTSGGETVQSSLHGSDSALSWCDSAVGHSSGPPQRVSGDSISGGGEAPVTEAEAEPQAQAQAPSSPVELSVQALEQVAGGAVFPASALLGTGPSGDVYRGCLGAEEVAVKLVLLCSQMAEDFLAEVEFMRQLNHTNVVRLLAFCPEHAHRAFVFELATKGSLKYLLHGRERGQLSWEHRRRVLLGAALGLAYLHTFSINTHDGPEGGLPLAKAADGSTSAGADGGQPHPAHAPESGVGRGLSRVASQQRPVGVVHKRVKSSNVLVFKGSVGKIADCRLQPPDQDSLMPFSSLPLGSTAWEAPEVFVHGSHTQKTDVYAFGILLLETLTGRNPSAAVSDGGRDHSLKDWALGHYSRGTLRDCLDPCIRSEEVSDSTLRRFGRLAWHCLNVTPEARPDMQKIVKALQKLA